MRGGIALQVGDLWPFVQNFQRLERDCFGTELSLFRKEVKGMKLLDRDRYKFAAQAERMEDQSRRKHCRGFLTRGLENKVPSKDEFTAYGQACLEMAHGIFTLLRTHRATLFASAIPRQIERTTEGFDEYLRKDHVFLLERFYYFLKAERSHGLLVMDEVEKTEDRRFVRRLHNYFTKTWPGRERAELISPSPLFVASDMTHAIQAADVCLYCINWGFRLPQVGMDATTRPEIAHDFGHRLAQLQFHGEGEKGGESFKSWGIVFVPDPNTPRSKAQKKGDNAFEATDESGSAAESP